MVSSELPEILGLCDRIVVMRDGRIAGRFERGEASEEMLMAAAVGARDAGRVRRRAMSPVEGRTEMTATATAALVLRRCARLRRCAPPA